MESIRRINKCKLPNLEQLNRFIKVKNIQPYDIISINVNNINSADEIMYYWENVPYSEQVEQKSEQFKKENLIESEDLARVLGKMEEIRK